MKATLKLGLHLSSEVEALLLDTLRQATASFNAVATYGWQTGQRNGARLHHATYHALRQSYPHLPSQLHCAARVKALEALKSTDERRRQVRKVSCPTSNLCAARYDVRSYWVKLQEGVASLATTGGRVCVRFNVCQYYQRYLTWKPCSADLCYHAKNGVFYLHVVLDAAAPETVREGTLGVDLGITEIASDSEGNQYSGDTIKSVRRRVRRIRRLLQSKGTKSAKRHLKRLRHKQSRFTRNTNHVISKRLVATAATSRKALALEDLNGIRDRAETVFSRQMRWLMGNWAFGQLRHFVSYKAQAAGLPVVLVDPRNTSRTCSRCGYCHKGNRKSQDKFLCLRCGFELNADFNAAINIGARADSSDGLLCRSKGSPNDQAQAPCL